MGCYHIGVFEHLDITSILDLDQRVKYTESTLMGPLLWKYYLVLLDCKDTDTDFPRSVDLFRSDGYQHRELMYLVQGRWVGNWWGYN